MPYFRKKHILLIHIPKTGGTTIHKRFMLEDTLELYNTTPNNKILPTPFDNISLQHQFYTTIYQYRDLLKVPFDDKLRVFTAVRNPYDRAISAMVFHKLINKYSTKTETYRQIKVFTSTVGFDNHNVPQHKFVEDENGNLVPGIIVMKTETLNEDLLRMGFLTTRHFNKGQVLNYADFLGEDTIKHINEYYKKDFELFGYEMRI